MLFRNISVEAISELNFRKKAVTYIAMLVALIDSLETSSILLTLQSDANAILVDDTQDAIDLPTTVIYSAF